MARVLAALDVGTNTVLLLTALQDARGELVEHTEACTTTRLGEGVDRTGRLSAAAADRTLAAVGEFMKRAESGGGEGAGVLSATSAVRDAANGAEFVQACQDRLGARPIVLSGAAEAVTTFHGVASDRAHDRFVILDHERERTNITQVAAGSDAAQAPDAQLGVEVEQRFVRQVRQAPWFVPRQAIRHADEARDALQLTGAEQLAVQQFSTVSISKAFPVMEFPSCLRLIMF